MVSNSLHCPIRQFVCFFSLTQSCITVASVFLNCPWSKSSVHTTKTMKSYTRHKEETRRSYSKRSPFFFFGLQKVATIVMVSIPFFSYITELYTKITIVCVPNLLCLQVSPPQPPEYCLHYPLVNQPAHDQLSRCSVFPSLIFCPWPEKRS